MATVTRGYSFGATEEVTAEKLHSLVDSATVTSIAAADITDGVISDAKIASVDGSKLVGLASVPAGSGRLPKANAPTSLQTSGSVDALTIATTGPITLPLQSAARAYRNGGQNISDGTATKVQLNAESYDVLGEFDSTTNNRFTATVAGYYQVNGQVVYPGPDANTRIRAMIYKNGAEVAANLNTLAYSTDCGVHVSDIVSLAIGDYLELYTQVDGSGTEAITGAATATYMSIHKLA